MISVEKVTVNIGVGAAGEKLEGAMKLIEMLTGQKPVETITTKRIPTWGVKKNMKIGAKVTLRGKKAADFLDRALDAVERKVKRSSFDKNGNFAFGIREYIDVPGVKYDPDIGMFGFDVCVTLGKWGYRVAERKRKTAHVPPRHRTTKDEAAEYAAKALRVEVI